MSAESGAKRRSTASGSIATWKSGDGIAQLFVCTVTSFLTVTQYKPSSVTDEVALARAGDIATVVLGRL